MTSLSRPKSNLNHGILCRIIGTAILWILSFGATAVFADSVDVSGFSSLAEAVASPSTAGKTILINMPVKCSTLAVPADRTLSVVSGGSVDVEKVLDFRGGKLDAGDFQVFSGSGSVINLGSSRVKWFGAQGDGKTEESVLVQKAINSVGSGNVLITDGTYIVANLQLKTGVNIIGQGVGSILKLPDNAYRRSINGSLADRNGNYSGNVIGTTLEHSGGKWFDNGTRARDEKNSTYIVTDVIIKDLVIDGNNAANTLGDVGMNGSAMGANICLNQAARITVENCRLANARLDGIMVGYTLHGGSDYITIKNCIFENNTRTGIALITGKYNKILGCTIKVGAGLGIDVEANWDDEVNYRHLIKGNYVEGGIALASARYANMTGIVVEGNTLVTQPGRNGFTLSSSRVNGGSLISNNKLLGAGGGGAAFAINGDSGRAEGYSPVLISNNKATDYDYIIPAQPNGGVANIIMRNNQFTTKYGIAIYRPYKFEFSSNNVLLSGGSNAAPLFYVLFGQTSVLPNQGVAIIKGNTVKGTGVSKLIEATIGADPPAITTDYLTVVGNDIDAAVSGTFPIELYYGITIKGNIFAKFNNSINCIGNIDGLKIMDNEFVALENRFPLINNNGTFKFAEITDNTLNGIDLSVIRPQYCNISGNNVINGKGRIIYSFTKDGVGSNRIVGNRFTASTDVDRAFEIQTGSGYAQDDFSGDDIIINNTKTGKYISPAFLNTTPKHASGNSF